MGRLMLGLLVLTSALGCLTEPRPQGWQRVLRSFAAPVHGLLRDPTTPQVIYAAYGWQALKPSQQMGGVLRSVDNGDHWIKANHGLPPEAEVLALAVAPAGFAGPGEMVLAGTRKFGLYVSSDQASSWQALGHPDSGTAGAGSLTGGSPGPDWQRLAVQALIGSEGTPPAVLVGTAGHGVLLSDDGGRSWQPRNNGLGNLNILALVSDSEGLIAGTWYGGVYRSTDRGQTWLSISQDYAHTALATVTVGGDGTLWLGLQNAGLAARPPSAETFIKQGEGVIDGVGVLAIAVDSDRIVLGTSGRGAVVGRRGGQLYFVDEGLENPTVSAVLLTPGAPGEIIIGTLDGLYRSLPPRSRALPLALATLVSVMALVLGFAVWRRSDAAAAASACRALRAAPADSTVRLFFEELILSPKAARFEAVMTRLAGRLQRLRNDPRGLLGPTVLCSAALTRLNHTMRSSGDAADRWRLATALDARAAALEELAARLPDQTADNGPISHLVALQDRVVASLLRTESLPHLTSLQATLEQLVKHSTGVTTCAVMSSDILAELRGSFDMLDQVNRMPSPEDRALFLAQALPQVLQTQQQAKASYRSRPSLAAARLILIYDHLEKLLSTTLQNIRQRAELRVELRSRVLATRREAVVVLEIHNVGRGHAQNVVAQLQPSEGSYRALQTRQDVKSLLSKQSARLEFLVEPALSDRVRLSFRIAYDDLVRSGHVLEFADVAEFRQVKPAQPFRPLRPNPYVVGRPLLENDVFTGREDLFERIESSLRGTLQDNVVFLIGQRRMGKTSVLRRLRHHLDADYAPVLVDLQGMLGSGEAAFFRELATTIYDELADDIDLVEPSPADFELDPGSYFRRGFLAGVCGALGQRRLLILFDEFEVLEQRIAAGELSPRLLPYLRSLMQHEERISFIFAGTHRLDELTSDYWGVLFNLALYLDVGHLGPPEVEQLLTVPSAGYFEIDPLAVDKVSQLTGGHPHFSQLVARELVELRNQQQLHYVTVQDLNAVADRVLSKGQLHIAYLWDDASPDERLLLQAIRVLLMREGLATLTTAHSYLEQRGIVTSDLPAAAASLLRKEILTEAAGLLSFRIELLRGWMDLHQEGGSGAEFGMEM